MARIKGIDGAGGPPAVGPAEEAGAAPEAGPVTAAAAPPAVDAAAVAALFDQVAVKLAAGGFADRTEAVRSIVDQVLSERLASASEPTRDRLATQITQFLLDDPAWSTRLNRLLEPAS